MRAVGDARTTGTCDGGTDHVEHQRLASGAIVHALVGRDTAGTNRIDVVRGAGGCGGYVVHNAELGEPGADNSYRV